MKRQLISTILAVSAGLVFILSSFVKAVDPVGFSYKITEYLSLFGIHGLGGLALFLSISLCSVETFLGLLLFLRIWKKTAAVCFLVAMLAFTAITLRLATDPFGTITECGCFGDAVHLSNGVSFAKNLMLLAAAAYLAHCVFKEGGKAGFKWRQLQLASGAFALSLAVPLLSCLFLPPFYFIDYNVGDWITEDNRIELFDRNLEHVRIDITGTDRPLYIIGLRRDMTDKEAAKITGLYIAYLAGNVDIVAASPSDGISSSPYKDIHLYYIDETTLKSILRSETGVVSISDGRITGKWNLKYTPYRFRDRYGKEITGQLLYRYGILATELFFLVFLCIVRYNINR